MAAKKKASAKKRTPAQRRATAKLVAMNKKKRAAKKKPAARRTARKKVARKTRARVTPRSTRATARKRNPSTKRYAIALEAFVPGQMVYVVSYNWRNGVWIVDTVKDRALRGTKQNMEEMANAVIQQLQKDNPKYNGQVYLDPV